MNMSNRSLEDWPSVVTKASPNIFLIILAISKAEEDAKEERDCEEHSNRSLLSN